MKIIEAGIHKLVQGVFDESVLKDMVSDGHETKVKDNSLNDNFYKKEFQELWKAINHKYVYTVDFDSEEAKEMAAEVEGELIEDESRDRAEAMAEREQETERPRRRTRRTRTTDEEE